MKCNAWLGFALLCFALCVAPMPTCPHAHMPGSGRRNHAGDGEDER
jgi:hypothetical protein